MSEEQKALSDVLDENSAKKKRVQKAEKAEPTPQTSENAEKSEEEQPEPAPEQTEDSGEKGEEEQAEPAGEAPQSEEEPAEKEQPEPEKEPVKVAPEIREAPKAKRRIEQNVVLVGKKPTMSYVLAAVTQFSDGINQVHIKARGRSISRAVDVAEVVRNRFVQNLQTDVHIGTQEITDDNNNKINVSTIEIVLAK